MRKYIHVKDAARYSVDILSKEFENQHVIVTGNQPITRGELLTMITEMLRTPIEVDFSPVDPELHYTITPYSFTPKLAKVYKGTYYLDLGQGLLESINEIYQQNFSG